MADVLVGHALHEGFDLRVAQLGFGLAFELWVTNAHGNNRGQAFTTVVTGKVCFLFFQKLVLTCVAVHQGGQRRAETFLVGAAFAGVNGVGEGVDGFLVGGVPLHCHLNLVVISLCLE